MFPNKVEEEVPEEASADNTIAVLRATVEGPTNPALVVMVDFELHNQLPLRSQP